MLRPLETTHTCLGVGVVAPIPHEVNEENNPWNKRGHVANWRPTHHV